MDRSQGLCGCLWPWRRFGHRRPHGGSPPQFIAFRSLLKREGLRLRFNSFYIEEECVISVCYYLFASRRSRSPLGLLWLAAGLEPAIGSLVQRQRAGGRQWAPRGSGREPSLPGAVYAIVPPHGVQLLQLLLRHSTRGLESIQEAPRPLYARPLG